MNMDRRNNDSGYSMPITKIFVGFNCRIRSKTDFSASDQSCSTDEVYWTGAERIHNLICILKFMCLQNSQKCIVFGKPHIARWLPCTTVGGHVCPNQYGTDAIKYSLIIWICPAFLSNANSNISIDAIVDTVCKAMSLKRIHKNKQAPANIHTIRNSIFNCQEALQKTAASSRDVTKELNFQPW